MVSQFMTGDLVTGEGIEPAVAGVAAIVHCASSKKGDAEAACNLVRAAASTAQPPHLVFISIVGVDQLSWGYMKAKLEAERIVANSGLPWTTQRATQFYDYLFNGAQTMAKLPVIPVPSDFLVQPIDPDDVAATLVELTLGEPAGRVPDRGGPQIASWAGMLRTSLRFRHRRRPVVEFWMPGLGKVRAGGLLVPEQATSESSRSPPDLGAFPGGEVEFATTGSSPGMRSPAQIPEGRMSLPAPDIRPLRHARRTPR
jgi:uncharacterized protein YbjT (DUF2867 family)